MCLFVSFVIRMFLTFCRFFKGKMLRRKLISLFEICVEMIARKLNVVVFSFIFRFGVFDKYVCDGC